MDPFVPSLPFDTEPGDLFPCDGAISKNDNGERSLDELSPNNSTRFEMTSFVDQLPLCCLGARLATQQMYGCQGAFVFQYFAYGV